MICDSPTSLPHDQLLPITHDHEQQANLISEETLMHVKTGGKQWYCKINGGELHNITQQVYTATQPKLVKATCAMC